MTRADEREAAVVWRARLLAACLLLSALMFHQSPGRIVPDTKLDLTANPGAFLERALHMWDPQGAFGQLQNQAYGYLFPVGPIHWVLDAVGLPSWVVQRLWWSIILAVAFLGFWRLSRALGIGSDWTRYAGAFFFALTPRMLGEVAVTSVEVWPLAMAPWVLLPLVDPRPRSWTWRISMSALAFACVGGVNAVATGATLVLPTLWFMTRSLSRRTAVAAVAWLISVVAVSLWWLVPLVLLGGYSPPFLDWIENAPVTTAFSSPWEALRGTTAWLGYLSGPGGPSWPGAWPFVTNASLIVATAAVSAGGLLGVLMRRCPERRFLVAGLVVGLVLVTLGHTGPAQSLLAPELQRLMDGALAPLRNTHKFELVVRVPLALGLVLTLSTVRLRAKGLGVPRWLVPVLAGSLLLATLSPALLATLARPESYRAIPDHWRETARWLDRQPGPGTVLVVPGASFADFTWGSTKDEPLQALMKRPFAVRDAVPLGSAGATRLLDRLEAGLASGTGGEELAEALRVLGIRYVVVRNDLRPDVTRNVQALVHEALAESGLARTAAFGPTTNNFAEGPLVTVDSHTRLPYPSVEVFYVGTPPQGTQAEVSSVARVVGGPEDVPAVLSRLKDVALTVTGTDAQGHREALGTAIPVLTDGNRRREAFFGRAADNTSATLTAEDRGRTGRRVFDYVSDPDAPQTVREWDGQLFRASASSSASDATATLRLGAGSSPAAALDGDPTTAWVSGRYGRATGEWFELVTEIPRDIAGTTVQFATQDPLGALPVEVTVDTDRGRTTAVVDPVGTPQSLAVPSGETSRLRVTVTKVSSGQSHNGVGIAELRVPGVDGGSSMSLPPLTGEASPAIVLTSGTQGTNECVTVGDRPLCSAALGRTPEEAAGLRRTLDLSASSRYDMTGEVVPRATASLDALVDGLSPIRAKASSRAVAGVQGRPGAAMDGELGTGWVAAPGDAVPTLTLTLPRRVKAGQVQLQVDQFLAASRATRVEVTLDDAEPFTADVTTEGKVSWSPRRFKSISLSFLQSSRARTIDGTGLSRPLPVGVSEVVVTGAPGLAPPLPLSAATGASCGYGPRVRVGDQSYDTKVTGDLAEVLRGQPMSWSLCKAQELRVPAGRVTVDAAATSEFLPVSMTLTPPKSAEGGDVEEVPVRRTSPTELSLSVAQMPSTSVVAIPQNYSPGWRATDRHGRTLSAIRVNGWHQGWIIPAGSSGETEVRFVPNRMYQVALVLGAFLVLVCGFVAAAAGRLRRASVTVPSSSRWWLLAVGAMVVLAFGWVGLVGLAVGAALRVGRVGQRDRLVVVVAVIAVAAVVAARDPWPQGTGGVHSLVVQLATLVALGVVVTSTGAARRSPRRPQRMSGRSSA